MPIDTISVGLDIKNEGLRSEFKEIFASQHEFFLTQHDPHRVADLLILDLGEDRGKTFAQIQAALTASPSTEIFLTSSQTDSEVLLEALRTGVKEFIPQPIQWAELEEALLRFKERRREKKPASTRQADHHHRQQGRRGHDDRRGQSRRQPLPRKPRPLGGAGGPESAIRRRRSLPRHGSNPYNGGRGEKHDSSG